MLSETIIYETHTRKTRNQILKKIRSYLSNTFGHHLFSHHIRKNNTYMTI